MESLKWRELRIRSRKRIGEVALEERENNGGKISRMGRWMRRTSMLQNSDLRILRSYWRVGWVDFYFFLHENQAVKCCIPCKSSENGKTNIPSIDLARIAPDHFGHSLYSIRVKKNFATMWIYWVSKDAEFYNLVFGICQVLSSYWSTHFPDLHEILLKSGK